MARKVWILSLTDAHKGPKVDGMDVFVVTDDNTAGTEAQALLDAAYPDYAGAWSTTLATEQDGSVTPAATGVVVAGKRKTVPVIAIAT